VREENMQNCIEISKFREGQESDELSKKMVIAILKNTVSSLEDYDFLPESKEAIALILNKINNLESNLN
jgi:hypothetical protein